MQNASLFINEGLYLSQIGFRKNCFLTRLKELIVNYRENFKRFIDKLNCARVQSLRYRSFMLIGMLWRGNHW